MAWRERSATVATSVVSGLLVAAVVKASNSGIADGVVILWFALATVGAGVLAWVTGVLIRRRRRSSRVFLMTSAFSQKYYLADLVQQVHKFLDRDGLDMVLKVPAVDYDAIAQSHNLDRIAARSRDYLGGIIIAAEMKRLHKDLVRFCHRSALPVVFTDLEPFDGAEDYPENAAFVGYDTGQLGEMAGRWLLPRLKNIDRPNVLVIASADHEARQQRCMEVLKNDRPEINIPPPKQCAFSRSLAHDAVRAHLGDIGPTQRLDAIFCTNDEMALGAVDALTPSTAATQDTVVIGIDGTTEAKALIDSRKSPLRATIVQDAERLAGNVVGVLQKLRDGDKVPRRTTLPARVYEA
ncbi:MAG: sugar ABC transporter substrate-binding protein [Actinophytocola sp.]|uniref:sugar ABC transporter substrate-binding protein n=1 Tax=Actinophytocola sp. TaxID=1872138 RepID=UPI003D6C2D59